MNPTEQDWIERTIRGDEEALSALLSAYREPALRWAMEILQDQHLAEDAVQEAFIRLPIKLNSLQDKTRFRPWFRQIVRRLALNLIRTSRRESLVADVLDTEGLANDPLHHVIEKESETEALANADAALSAKARSVMRQLVEEESSPEEIAERLQIAKSNVYNTISRSRIKANEERFRLALDRYLANRRRGALPQVAKLRPPSFSRPYSLWSVALLEVLRYAGEEDWTLTQLMGMTGDAFRLNVVEGCHWQGISTFDWSYAAHRSFELLGWQGRCFGRPGRGSATPEEQVMLLTMIHQSIDKGLPVIAWNLIINEFSLVYGYDNDSRTIFCRTLREVELPFSFDRLGRSGEEPGLFVAALNQRVTSPASDRTVLEAILHHAVGKQPPVPGFAFGLDGYQLWLEGAHKQSVDPLGHAYQVAILAEARYHAVHYLERMTERAQGPNPRRALEVATLSYRRVYEAIRRLYPSFPFGFGGAAGMDEWIADGLRAALEAESAGVEALKWALGQSGPQNTSDL